MNGNVPSEFKFIRLVDLETARSSVRALLGRNRTRDGEPFPRLSVFAIFEVLTMKEIQYLLPGKRIRPDSLV